MKLTQFKGTARISSASLDDWGKVGVPLGEPVSALRGTHIAEEAGGSYECGVWECTPGRWRRQIVKAEFCQFLAGRCTFTADSGEVLEIEAGDAIFFPANTLGIWDVKETVRKSYLVFDPA